MDTRCSSTRSPIALARMALAQAVQDGRTMAFGYSVDGSTNGFYQQTTYPDAGGAASGRVIKHILDKRGRVASIAKVSGSGPSVYATNTYDDADRLTERLFGNGTKLVREYDDLDQPKRIAHLAPGGAPFYDVSYGRDAVGNQLWKLDAIDPDLSERCWYDAMDRLIDFKRGALASDKSDVTTFSSHSALTQRQAWSILDSIGNWLDSARTQAGITTTDTRSHNAANEITQRTVDVGTNAPVTTDFQFDKKGNLLNDGAFTYDYDIESRLTRVSRILTQNPLATQLVGEYFYDALSRRTATTEYEDPQTGNLNPAKTTQHIYDAVEPLEDLIADASTAGWTLAREFVWGDRFPEPIIEVDHTDAGSSSAGADEVLYFMPDLLGSTVGLTNAAGILVERYAYDPYGRVMVERRDPGTEIFELNGGVNGSPSYSAFGNPFMWTGQRYDAAPDVYSFFYRTLSNVSQRWNQRDPLGYVDGTSLYEYVRSNPLVWRDPFGLQSTTHTPPGPGPRVESEVFPGDSNVHVQIGKDKYYYNPVDNTFHNYQDGARVTANQEKALLDNQRVMRGVRNGVQRVQSQGRGVFRIGPRTAVTISLVLGMFITETIDALDTLGSGRAYEHLLHAIDSGNLEEADRWAEELKDELIDGGHHHDGLNWINAWEKIIKPRLQDAIAKQIAGGDPGKHIEKRP